MEPDYDLQELLKTDIRTKIPEAVVSKITSSPPWVTVPGAFNVRDIGHSPSTPNVRSGFIYRSGVLSSIKEEGKSVLRDSMHITTIYDLRRPDEREKSPSPDIEGIETIWLPYGTEPGPVDLKLFGCGDGGASGYTKMYLEIADVLVPTYRRVFEHIRDSPEKPFMFHCMGGKDRTGVLAALILRLAGSSYDAIANDYVLTRIGVEPARDALMAAVKLNLFDIGETNPEDVGLLELCSVKVSAMAGFLKTIENSYQEGVKGYVKEKLGFSEEDVQKMCSNLRGE
ncbi:hypothetical protein PHISCL_05036 [Aspergillus sclerotialis]|uniref:Tyrosine specific protein phosphatases domain-containing protein n=1 Tax=Aspergillus sclerotialis TaxID=2070753 RepID=A0A3A2ZJY1_9EURO|nr:hypothetical protein PHISCL_05036 [Aspergillus sclerotialis]